MSGRHFQKSHTHKLTSWPHTTCTHTDHTTCMHTDHLQSNPREAPRPASTGRPPSAPRTRISEGNEREANSAYPRDVTHSSAGHVTHYDDAHAAHGDVYNHTANASGRGHAGNALVYDDANRSTYQNMASEMNVHREPKFVPAYEVCMYVERKLRHGCVV